MIFMWFKIQELYLVPTIISALSGYWYGSYKLGFVNNMWCNGDDAGWILLSVIRSLIAAMVLLLFIVLIVALIYGLKKQIPIWYSDFCDFIKRNWNSAEMRVINLEKVKKIQTYQNDYNYSTLLCKKCGDVPIESISTELVPKIIGDCLYMVCNKCGKSDWNAERIILSELNKDKIE